MGERREERSVEGTRAIGPRERVACVCWVDRGSGPGVVRWRAGFGGVMRRG